jgi:hypothetical protein
VDWAESYIPDSLRSDPHCWLFHELYDHSYGPQTSWISLSDCARIGKVLVEVKISQQYEIEVNKA